MFGGYSAEFGTVLNVAESRNVLPKNEPGSTMFLSTELYGMARAEIAALRARVSHLEHVSLVLLGRLERRSSTLQNIQQSMWKDISQHIMDETSKSLCYRAYVSVLDEHKIFLEHSDADVSIGLLSSLKPNLSGKPVNKKDETAAAIDALQLKMRLEFGEKESTLKKQYEAAANEALSRMTEAAAARNETERAREDLKVLQRKGDDQCAVLTKRLAASAAQLKALQGDRGVIDSPEETPIVIPTAASSSELNELMAERDACAADAVMARQRITQLEHKIEAMALFAQGQRDEAAKEREAAETALKDEISSVRAELKLLQPAEASGPNQLAEAVLKLKKAQEAFCRASEDIDADVAALGVPAALRKSEDHRRKQRAQVDDVAAMVMDVLPSAAPCFDVLRAEMSLLDDFFRTHAHHVQRAAASHGVGPAKVVMASTGMQTFTAYTPRHSVTEQPLAGPLRRASSAFVFPVESSGRRSSRTSATEDAPESPKGTPKNWNKVTTAAVLRLSKVTPLRLGGQRATVTEDTQDDAPSEISLQQSPRGFPGSPALKERRGSQSTVMSPRSQQRVHIEEAQSRLKGSVLSRKQSTMSRKGSMVVSPKSARQKSLVLQKGEEDLANAVRLNAALVTKFQNLVDQHEEAVTEYRQQLQESEEARAVAEHTACDRALEIDRVVGELLQLQQQMAASASRPTNEEDATTKKGKSTVSSHASPCVTEPNTPAVTTPGKAAAKGGNTVRGHAKDQKLAPKELKKEVKPKAEKAKPSKNSATPVAPPPPPEGNHISQVPPEGPQSIAAETCETPVSIPIENDAPAPSSQPTALFVDMAPAPCVDLPLSIPVEIREPLEVLERWDENPFDSPSNGLFDDSVEPPRVVLTTHVESWEVGPEDTPVDVSGPQDTPASFLEFLQSGETSMISAHSSFQKEPPPQTPTPASARRSLEGTLSMNGRIAQPLSATLPPSRSPAVVPIGSSPFGPTVLSPGRSSPKAVPALGTIDPSNPLQLEKSMHDAAWALNAFDVAYIEGMYQQEIHALQAQLAHVSGKYNTAHRLLTENEARQKITVKSLEDKSKKMADVIDSAHLQLKDRDWALKARERQMQQRDAVVAHLRSTVETLQLVTAAHNEAAARAEGKSMHRAAPQPRPERPASAGRAPLRVTTIQAVFTDFITVTATKLTPCPRSPTNAQKERVREEPSRNETTYPGVTRCNPAYDQMDAPEAPMHIGAYMTLKEDMGSLTPHTHTQRVVPQTMFHPNFGEPMPAVDAPPSRPHEGSATSVGDRDAKNILMKAFRRRQDQLKEVHEFLNGIGALAFDDSSANATPVVRHPTPNRPGRTARPHSALSSTTVRPSVGQLAESAFGRSVVMALRGQTDKDGSHKGMVFKTSVGSKLKTRLDKLRAMEDDGAALTSETDVGIGRPVSTVLQVVGPSGAVCPYVVDTDVGTDRTIVHMPK